MMSIGIIVHAEVVFERLWLHLLIRISSGADEVQMSNFFRLIMNKCTVASVRKISAQH